MSVTMIEMGDEQLGDAVLAATSAPAKPASAREAHAEDALCDIHDVCDLLRVSPSWVHNEVSRGKFPVPAIRKIRFVRWRLADLRAYIQKEASDPDAGKATRAHAMRASAAAKAKRDGVAAS